ncbi:MULTISPECIES: DUF2931 family protein [Aeromonas]|uniref:DUF2931 family protein n=1 Tax=Aeromonas salmonicida TaxID=645 RepID=A0AAX3VYQ5_AERSA|nr:MULTISPECIES: DUF2931 family protein [Aeromonas]MBP8174132.1 DUF2931 family protein [Aeromonadaceae bacterium]MBP8852207.1 DUF2931 family protein [Moraxellaceae bacterium]MCJ7978086.1 DUF2931 family protein [Aeromonas veronii]MDX7650080.1 DUF2931 family protein [Aeromonas caviae]UOR20041.1 DUF2931 family protein [Aeromonas veronii]
MRRILLLLLLPFVTACQAAPSTPHDLDWGHMVGSNADELWVTEVHFYRQGELVDASINGSAGFFGAEALKEKDYRWRIGKGRRDIHPAPDRVELEWISFHDKKRYRISLDLPAAQLEKMIAQRYRVKVGKEWLEERRDNIGLGMATGGYVEAFLRDPRVTPDILLARGIAKEVTDDPYDQRFPLSSQFKNAWARFDKDYWDTYQQYPVPSGMAWAPIMDAYRAAQPKTDTDPIQ